ncbi:MAG: hypothetical protein ACN2B6_11995 [Rickettsiales bacterium]
MSNAPDFDFDAAVAASDTQVFGYLGSPATVVPDGQQEPLADKVNVIYHNSLMIDGDEGFHGTYGNRTDGITYNTHYLEFLESSHSDHKSGDVLTLKNGDRFKLDSLAERDAKAVIYAVLKL